MDYSDFAESRHNILRAALELGDRIAALRRSLERAGGTDSKSLEFRDLDAGEWMKPARQTVATKPTA